MIKDEKIEIGLKISGRVVTLNIQPEMEPYFREAGSLINHRLDYFSKRYPAGEMNILDYLIIIALEGLVESQKSQDKYIVLQQTLNTKLDNLEQRISLK